MHLLLISLIIPIISCYLLKEPIVQTRFGYVRGITKYSRNYRPFNAYMGIPYAKPPIGQLRFTEPQPPNPWYFPLDATKDGPFCIQKNDLFDINATVIGQEDCLYLNVYVPQSIKQIQLMPVMVFIHYGAFFAGRATSDAIGPDYFMDKDVILVTFNYRLGVFGFLTTLDDVAPGNYALKDQVAALKWVQDNIVNFGGDNKQVTIFGQSVGSGSVHLHMISPLSQGLFQKAISESGTALNLWAKPMNTLQKEITRYQAKFVSCDHFFEQSQLLIDCLRKVDAYTLVASGDSFKYFSIEPLMPFTLVIENRTKLNPKPFLTMDPLEYIQKGLFANIPWIVGVVQDEGIIRAAPLLRQTTTREILNANFNNLLPQMLALELSKNNTNNLWDNIKDFYLNASNSIDIKDPKQVQGFIDMYSDRSFIYGTYQTITLHTLKHHTPIWLYNFNYRGQYSFGDLFATTKEDIEFNWGVSHCDDLLYLFSMPIYFSNLENDTDICMSNIMIKLWTNFAIHGHPDPLQEYGWAPLSINFKQVSLHYFNISGSAKDEIYLQIDNGFYKNRINFWANQSLNENFDFYQNLSTNYF